MPKNKHVKVTTYVFSTETSPVYCRSVTTLRGSLVDTFYETLDYCFDAVVGEMLGTTVRDSVYSLLERNRNNEESSGLGSTMSLMS